MALSGKTTNFELKYPTLVDDIVMGESGNDFKEMMDSVDAALKTNGIKTATCASLSDSGWDNITTPGFYIMKEVISNIDIPLIVFLNFEESGPPSMAQLRFLDTGLEYRTGSGGVYASTWMPFTTERITGKLSNLTTTTKTNLVSAINELKTNISDSGIIDLGLISGDLEQDDGAILLDVTEPGIYKYSVASGTEDEQEYLINAYNMWVHATTQFRFTYNSMYMRLLDPSTNNGQSVPWIKFATEDIIGNLTDLTTTAKTDLVSAINEVKDSIPAAVEGDTIKKIDITKDILQNPGQQYSESKGVYYLDAGNTPTIASAYLFVSIKSGTICQQTLVIGNKTYYREWSIGSFANQDWQYLSYEISTVVLPGQTDISKIGVYGKGGEAATTASGFTFINNFAPVTYIKIPASAFESAFGDSYDYILYQILDVVAGSGYINQVLTNGVTTYRRNLTISAQTGTMEIEGEWTEDNVSSKKYSTIVIGNSGSGLTANDVDYLYEEGTDFGTVLTSVINKLTSSGAKGGEIKILSGTYTLTSAVTTSGTSTAPIKITGEGKSTIITSATPTSYYISVSYCEISECRLDTDIRITTNGYVNIHDCEIAERIYFNNSSSIYDVFIHDNNLDYTTTGKDFLYLSGSGSIYNFQVYNNYCYKTSSFDFLYAAATKPIYSSSIRNNHCPYGTWNSSNYSLTASSSNYFRNIMTGNTFYTINFSGGYWDISNNHIISNLYLYDGNYLDVMNNRVDGAFTAASGLTHANITGNVIDAVATISPYVNLGTYSRFVNNVIQDTNFSTTYIPGYDDATNKWGNNMWADGFDRMIFANQEGIGEGQGDA